MSKYMLRVFAWNFVVFDLLTRQFTLRVHNFKFLLALLLGAPINCVQNIPKISPFVIINSISLRGFIYIYINKKYS